MLRCLMLFSFAFPAFPLVAQTINLPLTAQTDLYFPHLADGGPVSDQWQTRFTFINPNIYPTDVALTTFSNTGGALDLDFGSGPTNQTTFTIPANGTTVLQSRIASSVTVTGWAVAGCSLPVQANVAFRRIQNGVAKLEITAEPTLPSGAYRSAATPLVGIALANVWPSPLAVTVTVFGGAGQTLGQGSLTIPPHGHSAFNLFQVPGVPAAFTGSVVLTPQTPGQLLLAWANYSDPSGVISSLPDGRAAFPAAHIDQITNAFNRVVGAYQLTLLPDFGPTPQLMISPVNEINAHASNGNVVQINLAVAELISDSPSELAFIVAHELGHIYQQRTGKFVWSTDPEWDADQWGLTAELVAGYDPYAGAGALGKLAMATATAGLQAQLIQNWEQMTGADAHGSFATRIDNLTVFLEQICAFTPALQAACGSYKTVVHPHFPALPSVPLARPIVGAKKLGASTSATK